MKSYYGVMSDAEAALKASTDGQWSADESKALEEIARQNSLGNASTGNDMNRRYRARGFNFVFRDGAEGINIGLRSEPANA